jgi:hypothetical protein
MVDLKSGEIPDLLCEFDGILFSEDPRRFRFAFDIIDIDLLEDDDIEFGIDLRWLDFGEGNTWFKFDPLVIVEDNGILGEQS